MTNFSATIQDLSNNLTLDKLKQIIEPFRNVKILVGITCRTNVYDYILKTITKDIEGIFSIPLYKINNQKENVKYFYDNKELKDYLIKNI